MADPILLKLDTQHYYYGTTPKQAVAEQNQTFFAYFDTLADTSPVLQNHTAYYVKYIIDTNGNPVNPEPDSNPNRPQAIGLYNLLDNFEVGKNAIIKTITNDPLYDIPPNSYMLNGSYPIVHVGRLTPILLTTTGSGAIDYITTMSFQDPNGNPLAFNVPALNAFYKFQGSIVNVDINSPTANPSFTGLTTNPYWAQTGANTVTFTYPGGTLAAGTRIKLDFSVGMKKINPGGATSKARLRIWRGGTGFGEYVMASSYSNTDGDLIINSEWNAYNIGTGYFSPNENDYFRFDIVFIAGDPMEVGGVTNNPAVQATYFQISQQTPPGDAFINGITGTTASYWTVDTSNYEPSTGLSVLTSSQYLYNFYNTNYYSQITPPESLEIGYPLISTPFYPILPGDKIKFTLNETDVHTITNVSVGSQPTYEALYLTITPPIDSNTILDNFTLYRIVNDGTSVILQVKKDISGSAYAGVVQPQFVSKELVDNYDKIITDLTQKSIIA